MIPASRKVTSTPGIRPTGSLRIALGERCFREPTLQAALVRLTFQCMVGSRLPRQSAASIAEMPCRLQLQSLSYPTTSLNTSPFVQSTTSQWPPLSGPMRRRRPAAFRFERCRCIADLLIPTIATMSPCVACGRSFKSPSRRSAFF